MGFCFRFFKSTKWDGFCGSNSTDWQRLLKDEKSAVKLLADWSHSSNFKKCPTAFTLWDAIFYNWESLFWWTLLIPLLFAAVVLDFCLVPSALLMSSLALPLSACYFTSGTIFQKSSKYESVNRQLKKPSNYDCI